MFLMTAPADVRLVRERAGNRRIDRDGFLRGPGPAAPPGSLQGTSSVWLPRPRSLRPESNRRSGAPRPDTRGPEGHILLCSRASRRPVPANSQRLAECRNSLNRMLILSTTVFRYQAARPRHWPPQPLGIDASRSLQIFRNSRCAPKKAGGSACGRRGVSSAHRIRTALAIPCEMFAHKMFTNVCEKPTRSRTRNAVRAAAEETEAGARQVQLRGSKLRDRAAEPPTQAAEMGARRRQADPVVLMTNQAAWRVSDRIGEPKPSAFPNSAARLHSRR